MRPNCTYSSGQPATPSTAQVPQHMMQMSPLPPMPPPGYYPPGYEWQPPSWNYAPRQPSANPFPGPGQRAWFTKEHLELIEKWKTCDVAEESKKIGQVESSGRSNTTKNKRGKVKEDEDSESEIKTWISSTFSTPLKKIATKLEDVDKRTATALEEREKVKKRGDGVNLEAVKVENGNSEKGKREFASPIAARSKSNAAIDEGKEPSSTRKEMDKLDEIKGILVKLLGKMGTKDYGELRTREETKQTEDVKGKGNMDEEENKEKESDTDIGRSSNRQTDHDDVMEYMKCRLDCYMTLKCKEIRELYKKREIECDRKDKAAWELAKQDTELFSKLVNNIEEEERELSEEEDDDKEEKDDFGEEEEDDVTQN
ncbi:hypothetical protein CBR_g30847 [Chara braunii]|uniref:Uncharacterized protein n=1 Tax=Chara braunii TaxID=69332 RepID=A0A388JXJ1_CHABU|nr:hypothetical protein CBR_g30847 [Chara braunii]|eukprot:GBG62529.1 hypothetical protein CBR_g30847 [Chara braunii]